MREKSERTRDRVTQKRYIEGERRRGRGGGGGEEEEEEEEKKKKKKRAHLSPSRTKDSAGVEVGGSGPCGLA